MFSFWFQLLLQVIVCATWTRALRSGPGNATECLTPTEIPLKKGTIFATSADRTVKPGDIHYKICSHAPTRPYIGWCPGETDSSPQIRIRLPAPMSIHGIVFQKLWARCPDGNHDVTEDPYLATFDGHYEPVDDKDGSFVSFAQNVTALTPDAYEKIVRFPEPLVTKSMVLMPRSFHKSPCFRFKIFGCPLEGKQDFM